MTPFKKLKMGLRKFFNYPNHKEIALITEGRNKLVNMAKELASKYHKEETNRQTEKNETCPKCGNKHIVNKIARVEGNGYVSGSFMFGSGSVYGKTNIDTNEINHCNKCGNQWKKYVFNYKFTDNFIADWMDDLNRIFEGKYITDNKILTLLKDIPAESIWEEGKRVASLCAYSTRENMSLELLRTKFKSVYK